MKTTKKNLSTTQVEIIVTLDRDDLEPARKKAIARLGSQVKVAGFRKGKVPLNVAEKHINPNDLANTTLDIAVRTSLPQAFEKEKVQPLSIPNVSVEKYVPGEMMEYKATSDIMPEIKLGKYKGLKAKRPQAKTTPQDVDGILDNIAHSYAEKKVANRAAQLGDDVQIDFKGMKDGVAFEGGSAKNHNIVLGSNQFIPGFEDGVVGHKVGDKFDIKLTFPKDYHNADLASQKVVFGVLLKQVNELITPEIDDALAQKTGPFKTLDELKADIKKNLDAQSGHNAEEKYKDDLVTELVSGSTVDAPATLVSDQLAFIRQDLQANLKSRGINSEDYFKKIDKTEEEWEKDARKIAEQRVKAALVLQTLAKELKLSASDEEVAVKLAELREVYKNNEEAKKNLADPRVHADIKNRLTIEKTLTALAKLNG